MLGFICTVHVHCIQRQGDKLNQSLEKVQNTFRYGVCIALLCDTFARLFQPGNITAFRTGTTSLSWYVGSTQMRMPMLCTKKKY